jgi:hypothetical protein
LIFQLFSERHEIESLSNNILGNLKFVQPYIILIIRRALEEASASCGSWVVIVFGFSLGFLHGKGRSQFIRLELALLVRLTEGNNCGPFFSFNRHPTCELPKAIWTGDQITSKSQ